MYMYLLLEPISYMYLKMLSKFKIPRLTLLHVHVPSSLTKTLCYCLSMLNKYYTGRGTPAIPVSLSKAKVNGQQRYGVVDVNGAGEWAGRLLSSAEERSCSHVVLKIGSSGASLWQGGREVATPSRLTSHG